ncbi:MAG: HEAT repeat domain-containing protein [Christensenellales bacterium]|jgi:HEAT repeat protein
MNTCTIPQGRVRRPIEDPELMKRLMQHAKSPDERIRAAAYAGLAYVHSDMQVIMILHDGMADPNDYVRSEAIKSLKKHLYQIV